MLKQSNQERDQLFVVTFLRSRVLFIHLLLLNNKVLEEIYLTQILKWLTQSLLFDEDHSFHYQLDQWGVENLFQNSDEVIIRKLRLYIED